MADETEKVESKNEDLPAAPPPRGSSLAGRASCLSFIFLAIAALTIWIIILRSSRDIPWTWGWFALIAVLVLVIPFVVFRAITLWMMGERSRFPDIDYAWRVGVAALEEHGMSLNSAPIFVILGAAGERQRQNLMNAAGYKFRVEGVPNGPAPLHWYANPDVIFVVLNDVCWLSQANVMARRGRRDQPKADASEEPGAEFDFRGTIAPQALTQVSEQSEGKGGTESGTPDGPSVESSGGSAFGAAQLRGTMAPPSVAANAVGHSTAPSPPKTGRLSSEKSTQLLARLQAVCSLIRRGRYPICPINGMLVLLPFEVLSGPRGVVHEVERAIAADLAASQRELRLRCPITAIVTGMEQESGFRELMRRVGRQRCDQQRFGQRYDLRREATVGELEKFAAHVCGTFEDWVYVLFGEKDALSRPGNALLYALLCKVRRSVQTRLGKVLAGGFGYNPGKDEDSRLFFSGCYFAATGAKADRQAFVRGLLDKLRGEQEEIEWTEDALYADYRRRSLTRVGWVVSLILILALGAWFVYDRF